MATGAISSIRSLAACSSSALVWAIMNVSITALTRSNSAIGSVPSINRFVYSIQSLSRVAASQKPSSWISSISRRVNGPIDAPNRNVTDTKPSLHGQRNWTSRPPVLIPPLIRWAAAPPRGTASV